jgi:hypothetical protein
MKLYHGTNAETALRAVSEGLKPRELTKHPGNWEEYPARADLIYLTSAYAGHFAGAAAKDQLWGIVEVDVAKLNKANLLPDEDFLEQTTRMDTGRDFDLRERTAHFRDSLEDFQKFWETSLNTLGNLAYKGAIPPKAISRISTYDPKSNPILTWACDPTITPINYAICGEMYRALTRWYAGHSVTAKKIWGMYWNHANNEQKAKYKEAVQNTKGITILK